MEIINLKQLFAGPVVNALCHTLFHSLWQGVIFAAVAGLVVIFTRQSGPILRYRLLIILFLLMIGTSVITFIYQLQWFRQLTLADVHNSGNITQASYPVYHTSPVGTYPVATRQFSVWLSAFLSRYAFQITVLWLIVLMAKTVRMVSVLTYTRYCVKRDSKLVSAYWSNRIQWFCRQLQINRKVKVMESAFIKVPVVFGHLKPVIFIPLGLLGQLPPGQIEAILLHELAHIRRADYLVNLLQNIAESIFFFSPAVLWLSALIRDERENCCDDAAVAQTSNKKQYIEALISFREFSLNSRPRYVVAFAGKKGSLLSRVTRMVHNNNHGLNTTEKSSLVGACIIALLLAIFATPASSLAVKRFTKHLKEEVIAVKQPVKTSATRVINKIDKPIAPSHADSKMPVDTLQKQEDAPAIQVAENDEPVPNNDVLVQQPDTTPVNPYYKKHKALSLNNGELVATTYKKGKGEGNITQLELGRRKKSPPKGFPLPEVIAHISDYLFDHGIITDRENLSFKLTNAGLTVNGVKQSDELAQTMANRYFNEFPSPVGEQGRSDPNFGIVYNAQTGSMGFGIMRHEKKPVAQ
ncbi:M56 family metallopeptidase [Mucilaginibacter boryungensis]|uniref:M56 family metallopeptidase n=1 Tax=Mucilaginibacter boryungensis TaxID=768480 RepID=A0ABR9XEL2_9SPHI|nr:M56 family metallopeptidase [Mucilaginibacter boryungensis]MBE9665640.1 M56 family metallopeptidase [Mucilaginibacter boryungensis]